MSICVGVNNIGRCYFVLTQYISERPLDVNTFLYLVFVFQTQYFIENPRGVNPVQLNDVVFSLHAVLMCAITILQCFLYEVIFI